MSEENKKLHHRIAQLEDDLEEEQNEGTKFMEKSKKLQQSVSAFYKKAWNYITVVFKMSKIYKLHILRNPTPQIEELKEELNVEKANSGRMESDKLTFERQVRELQAKLEEVFTFPGPFPLRQVENKEMDMPSLFR